MTTNIALQIFSIVCSISIVLYIAYEQGHKKYSFWHIFIRLVRFNDKVPLNWLLDRKYLIAYWFLAIGQLITISGLLRELGMGSIDGKPAEFFFAAPMTKICVLYLLHELVKAKSPAYRKKIDLVVSSLGRFTTNLTK